MHQDRFTPLVLHNSKIFTNRVVVPPMASETATNEGFVTDKTLSHYVLLSQSKAALVMVEYSYVHHSGRSEENQLAISHDAHSEGLKQLARAIHQEGSLAGIQLTHAGGKTSRSLTSGHLMTPSGVTVPVKDEVLEAGDEMSLLEIDLWKTSFLEAAMRGAKAGFDIIELHAAHGYGLNQWLSPLTNKRNDKYGGSLSHRARLLLEIVAAIKKALPEIILAVRLPGQDFLEGGLTIDDSCWLARELELSGVDIIDVSSGIGGWKRPRERRGEGYLTEEAREIQKAISAPVIGVGGIEKGVFIDQGIRERRFSLAAVGRAILKAPNEWGELNLTKTM